MAKYTVTGPDGQAYTFEGPEGATDQQLVEHVKKVSQESPTWGQTAESAGAAVAQGYLNPWEEIARMGERATGYKIPEVIRKPFRSLRDEARSTATGRWTERGAEVASFFTPFGGLTGLAGRAAGLVGRGARLAERAAQAANTEHAVGEAMNTARGEQAVEEALFTHPPRVEGTQRFYTMHGPGEAGGFGDRVLLTPSYENAAAHMQPRNIHYVDIPNEAAERMGAITRGEAGAFQARPFSASSNVARRLQRLHRPEDPLNPVHDFPRSFTGEPGLADIARMRASDAGRAAATGAARGARRAADEASRLRARPWERGKAATAKRVGGAIAAGAAGSTLSPIEGNMSDEDYWRQKRYQMLAGGAFGPILGSDLGRSALSHIASHGAVYAGPAAAAYKFPHEVLYSLGLAGYPLYRGARALHRKIGEPMERAMARPSGQAAVGNVAGQVAGDKKAAITIRPLTGQSPDDEDSQ